MKKKIKRNDDFEKKFSLVCVYMYTSFNYILLFNAFCCGVLNDRN